MRSRIPSWTQGSNKEISKARYAELKAFCMQYDERRREARFMLDNYGGSISSVSPFSGTISDPTFKAVDRREKLLSENALIDNCLQAVDGGIWADALRMNICKGIPYNSLDPALIPTSHRETFFQARKAFFLLLDQQR